MAAIAMATGSACDGLPRDADGTLDRVRSAGVMRVGVSEAPPWVTREEGSGARPGGPEAELAVAFAASLGAEVQWQWGGHEDHLERLGRRELDLVVAGLNARSPWRSEVALTRPYAHDAGTGRVLAVAPGENAFLVALERFLLSHSDLAGEP